MLQKVLALTGDVVASPATRQNMLPTQNPLLRNADRFTVTRKSASSSRLILLWQLVAMDKASSLDLSNWPSRYSTS